MSKVLDTCNLYLLKFIVKFDKIVLSITSVSRQTINNNDKLGSIYVSNELYCSTARQYMDLNRLQFRNDVWRSDD